jgi:hypothetical protein
MTATSRWGRFGSPGTLIDYMTIELSRTKEFYMGNGQTNHDDHGGKETPDRNPFIQALMDLVDEVEQHLSRP